MEPDNRLAPLTSEQKWARLRAWLHEKVAEVQGDNRENLPDELGGQATEVSVMALEAVLAEMDILDANQA